MPFAGESVQTSGIYRSVHYPHREADCELALLVGQRFPKCDDCDDCEYVLVRAAPGTEEDGDMKAKPSFLHRHPDAQTAHRTAGN